MTPKDGHIHHNAILSAAEAKSHEQNKPPAVMEEAEPKWAPSASVGTQPDGCGSFCELITPPSNSRPWVGLALPNYIWKTLRSSPKDSGQ